MSTKRNFNNSSQLLISTLIATSFFMVNCNNSSHREGVKSNTIASPTGPDLNAKPATSASGDLTGASVAGSVMTSADSTVTSGDSTAASSDLTTVETVECSDVILKLYSTLNTEFTRVQGLHAKNKTAASPEKLSSDYKKVLSLCDDLGAEFDKASLKTCKYKNAKNQTEDIKLNKAPSQCLITAAELYLEDGTETTYLKLFNDQKKLHKQYEKQTTGEASFIGTKLLISEEMKAMLKPENLNFKTYIVDGEIKTDQTEMKKNILANKVVCSFVGTSTSVDPSSKVFLNPTAYEDVNTKNMPEESNGVDLALAVSTEKSSESSGTFQRMSCSQLSKEKINIKLLKKAFGSHLVPQM